MSNSKMMCAAASQSQNAGDVELNVLFEDGAYLDPGMREAIQAQVHAMLHLYPHVC